MSSTRLKDKVAVVVLNYNDKQRLKECLMSLVKSDYPSYEIIVLDNNSNDGSVELVEDYFKEVKIRKLDKNYGYVAYNKIVSKLDCKYVALLNNDIIVNRDWLSKLIHPLSSNDDVAAVTPKIKFVNSNKINAAGGICDIFGVGWNRGNGEEDIGQYNWLEEVFYGVGACLVLKKKVWDEISGFDERYFIYAEDLDWCWRARLAGYRILYVPDAVVEHYWHSSINTSFMVYLMEKNQISNFIKNYGIVTIIKLFPLILIIKTLKLIGILVYYRKFDLFISLLKSYVWTITNIKETLAYRKNCKRIKTDKDIQKLMEKTSLEIELALKIRKHSFVTEYL